VDEITSAIEGRPSWHLDGSVAVYEPGGAWTGRVREIAQPQRAYERWHAAAFDERGVAGHIHLTGGAAQAVAWIERNVRSLNG
jgi:hypothetical protein